MTAPPASPSTALVVAADRAIFPLLAGLLRSLRPLDRGRFAVCVIDLGLTEAQRAFIAPDIQRIEPIDDARLVHPAPDLVAGIRDRVPFWKALTARPFVPEYFPGFAQYIGVDADTWFQRLNVLDFMAAEAAAGRLTIAPELDVAYAKYYGADVHENEVKDKTTLTRGFFGDDAAAMTGPMPYYNIGLYGLPAGSPYWSMFKHYLTEVTKTRFHFLCESVVFNIVMLQLRNFTLLPATCNWMCLQARPVKGADGLWRSPAYPFPVIEMLHLTGGNKLGHYRPLGLLHDEGRYLDDIRDIL